MKEYLRLWKLRKKAIYDACFEFQCHSYARGSRRFKDVDDLTKKMKDIRRRLLFRSININAKLVVSSLKR